MGAWEGKQEGRKGRSLARWGRSKALRGQEDEVARCRFDANQHPHLKAGSLDSQVDGGALSGVCSRQTDRPTDRAADHLPGWTHPVDMPSRAFEPRSSGGWRGEAGVKEVRSQQAAATTLRVTCFSSFKALQGLSFTRLKERLVGPRLAAERWEVEE